MPSLVVFLGDSAASESGNGWAMPVGMDEWDVLLGAFRIPRGLLWSEASNNTDPLLEVSLGSRTETGGQPSWGQRLTWDFNGLFVFENSHGPFGGAGVLESTGVSGGLPGEDRTPWPPWWGKCCVSGHAVLRRGSVCPEIAKEK